MLCRHLEIRKLESLDRVGSLSFWTSPPVGSSGAVLVHSRFGSFSLYLYPPLISNDKEARQASSRLGLVHPQRAEAKKEEPGARSVNGDFHPPTESTSRPIGTPCHYR
jgi:hypothetical protein